MAARVLHINSSLTIDTIDYHTAGEPFRIVTGGVNTPPGQTVLDRRGWAQDHLHDVRAFLINEPRGHADMYGCFVTPPDDEDGDLGVVFFHKDGFSTACGHGTIALATWALDHGVIEATSSTANTATIVIDAPSGRLRAEASLDEDGRVGEVKFWNVPSFVSDTGLTVDTSHGPVTVDVGFGGAFYGSVDLAQLPLRPDSGDLIELIALGRQIKAQFTTHPAVSHRDDDRLSGMYGVIFYHDIPASPSEPRSTIAVRQRNVTVFADGEVDRSPCGSGTSARLALLHHHGDLAPGDVFENHGIAGGVFHGRVESIEHDSVLTSVTGSAFETGQSCFVLDPRDRLGLGFQLR